jgi:hypothetical protein
MGAVETMKNYVVWHNCEIQDTNSAFGLEAAGAPGVANRYSEMHRISLISALHFLQGSWAPVVFSEPAESRVAMFKQSWQRIRELWHREPCNILYLDSDTIMVQPTEIFGKFDNFRMFNHSTPPSQAPFEHYFNAAVRYYPHTMTRDVWDLGDNLAMTWNLDIWDQEQIIFNHMLWSQPVTFETVHRPDLNYQAPTGGVDQLQGWHSFNGCEYQAAHIIHYHGTRSSNRGVELATALANQLGLII